MGRFDCIYDIFSVKRMPYTHWLVYTPDQTQNYNWKLDGV